MSKFLYIIGICLLTFISPLRAQEVAILKVALVQPHFQWGNVKANLLEWCVMSNY